MENSNSTTIGLVNPKTPTNMGAIMRAAGCYQVACVRYTGERFGYAVKYHTDTKDIFGRIPLLNVESLVDGLPPATKIVCVELVEGASPLPEFVHPEQAIYIFGPEDGSVPQELIDRADHVVYIPTIGCMNLAATVNVLLYDRLAKSPAAHNCQEHIVNNRDINNRLRMKLQNSET